MATHAIGKDTCNQAINFAKDERAILGRLALAAGMSFGAYCRDKIRIGVGIENPAEAARIVEIRRARKALALAALFLGALTLVAFTHADSAQFSRARRIVRVRFEEMEAAA